MMILIGKVDIWQKRKTFRVWIENGNVKVMQSLNSKILKNVADIDDKNKILGLKDAENQAKMQELDAYKK